MKEQMKRGIKAELKQQMMIEFGDVRNKVGSMTNKVNEMNKTMVNYCSRMIFFWMQGQ